MRGNLTRVSGVCLHVKKKHPGPSRLERCEFQSSNERRRLELEISETTFNRFLRLGSMNPVLWCPSFLVFEGWRWRGSSCCFSLITIIWLFPFHVFSVCLSDSDLICGSIYCYSSSCGYLNHLSDHSTQNRLFDFRHSFSRGTRTQIWRITTTTLQQLLLFICRYESLVRWWPHTYSICQIN